jgi:hypothetical protein
VDPDTTLRAQVADDQAARDAEGKSQFAPVEWDGRKAKVPTNQPPLLWS